jgi:hypothetical protein
MQTRRLTPMRFRLQLVVATLEIDFDADEHPSLPGMQVYDTTCDEPSSVRPGLAKCGPVAGERKRAGGGK